MITAVILAAGKGTRMKSSIPKVLHQVVGKPLLGHVCSAVSFAKINHTVIVVGSQAEQIKEALGTGFTYATQVEPLGTGHAVLQAMPCIDENTQTVLVLSGDTPLLTGETLDRMLSHHLETAAAATVLTAVVPDAKNYGRIVRNQDAQLQKIVEEADASIEEKKIQEINAGTYCFNRKLLFEALEMIDPDNKQGEYYLTDVIEILVKRGCRMEAIPVEEYTEVQGINNRVQLAEAEKLFRKRINRKWMLEGVTMLDPETVYIESDVEIGVDTLIEPFVHLKGKTKIGTNCKIGPEVSLTNVHVGDASFIRSSTAVDASIGAGCNIGPYSYLRPNTRLEDNVKIGDFVEIKNTTVGPGSKIPHLAYIGDTVIGTQVNIGAGTITCNYDGQNKWQTSIDDGAFIGSNTSLVAPVKIGEKAVVGAGSTITTDVPARALAVGRQRQKNIENWTKNEKNK